MPKNAAWPSEMYPVYPEKRFQAVASPAYISVKTPMLTSQSEVTMNGKAIPDSYLEASSDLGGRTWRTFRSVLLPLALPGVVAVITAEDLEADARLWRAGELD